MSHLRISDYHVLVDFLPSNFSGWCHPVQVQQELLHNVRLYHPYILRLPLLLPPVYRLTQDIDSLTLPKRMAMRSRSAEESRLAWKIHCDCLVQIISTLCCSIGHLQIITLHGVSWKSCIKQAIFVLLEYQILSRID